MHPPLAARVVTLASLACFPAAAPGQSYPEKPIRIVTTVPGGSLDLTARSIAPRPCRGAWVSR